MCCLGYAFLLFQEESSVQALIEACLEEDGKLYLCVSSPTIKDKPVSFAANLSKPVYHCQSFLYKTDSQQMSLLASSIRVKSKPDFNVTLQTIIVSF